MLAGTSLLALLERTAAKPRGLEPGAALALSLHCYAINAGFSSRSDGSSSPQARSAFAPPSGWLTGEKDVWTFHYRKDGKENGFTVVVSLHPASGRVFVHASEDGNINNIKVLGLQLENYIPSAQALRNNSWLPGMVQNPERLEQLVHEHILDPLVADARDMSPRSMQAQRSRGRSGSSRFATGPVWEGFFSNGADGEASPALKPYISYLAVSAVAVAGLAAVAGAAVALKTRTVTMRT